MTNANQSMRDYFLGHAKYAKSQDEFDYYMRKANESVA